MHGYMNVKKKILATCFGFCEKLSPDNLQNA